MSLFSLIIIATAVSIDGFWGGFAFGLRKIKINFTSLLVISFWSVVLCGITMSLGHFLKDHISFALAKWISALLLFAIGAMALKEGIIQRSKYIEKNQHSKVEKIGFKDLFRILDNPLLADVDGENDVKPGEGTLLGLAVAMDAAVAAFTVALAGYSPFTTPFLFGLTHFVLIGLGNFVALKQLIHYFAEKFALLPGVILIALGVLRLI